MTGPPAPIPVAILAFPATTASVVYGMYDLFLSAGRDWGMVVDGVPGPERYAVRIVAARPGEFTATNEIPLRPQATCAAAGRPDIICVPEVALPPSASTTGLFDSEIAWLRECHAAGSIIATACSGAVLLAEAGLLEGEEATTHWAYCDVLAERFPGIRLRPRSALVAAGEGQRLVMAGGGTSWLDLVLYLIGRTAGLEIAMQVARINLIDWHSVGQQPYARLARSRQAEDAVIARCQVWIASNYAERAPVAAMVRLSGLPERSFKRRFMEATGLAPLEYVHTLRLEEAKQMLEAGDEPVEAVATAVGYEDAGFFSRLFRRKVGLTPAQYRRRFGALRRALAGP